jgi:hypothetical protein
MTRGATGASLPGPGVRQACWQRSQRSLRLRPANAASGTSYSVEQFGHGTRILISGMTFLRRPRNKLERNRPKLTLNLQPPGVARFGARGKSRRAKTGLRDTPQI